MWTKLLLLPHLFKRTSNEWMYQNIWTVVNSFSQSLTVLGYPCDLLFLHLVRQCPVVVPPANALPSNCGGNPGNLATFGSVCSFYCPHGFAASGVDTVQCLANSTWSQPLFACDGKWLCFNSTEAKRTYLYMFQSRLRIWVDIMTILGGYTRVKYCNYCMCCSQY